MIPTHRALSFWIRQTVLLTIASWTLAVAAADQRPNILFLFADDQRADTIAALGNPVIRTPNLDRIARTGLSFSRAYMQGGLQPATCTPSRAMLLSGRPLFRADSNLMRDETWPAAFGKAGYTTFLTGKWHNGAPSVARSFQRARSVFTGGMTDPMHAPLSDLADGRLTRPKITPDAHACGIFADEAIRFIREDHTQPFFCYIPFDAPHDPHIVPDGFPVRYDARDIPLPASFLTVHPFDNGEMKVRDELLLPTPRDPDQVRALLAEYYRYVSYLDSQIGRVLDALAASPSARNTVIIFAADSGVARGSHGLVGKQNLYEESIRVPLLIAGPGIPAGRRTEALCYLYDLLPTLGAWCDVPAPTTSEGLDLGPVLRDPDQPGRSDLVFAYRDVQRAVRTSDWKLIQYPKAGRTQLFDLKSDPLELHDLAGKSEQAGLITSLTVLMDRKLSEAGDSPPLRIKPAPTRTDP